jgi:hypothetical protein
MVGVAIVSAGGSVKGWWWHAAATAGFTSVPLALALALALGLALSALGVIAVLQVALVELYTVAVFGMSEASPPPPQREDQYDDDDEVDGCDDVPSHAESAA